MDNKHLKLGPNKPPAGIGIGLCWDWSELSNSELEYIIRIQYQDPGLGSVIKIQDQDPESGSKIRIQDQNHTLHYGKRFPRPLIEWTVTIPLTPPLPMLTFGCLPLPSPNGLTWFINSSFLPWFDENLKREETGHNSLFKELFGI